MKKMLLLSLGIVIYIACFTGYVQASLKKAEINNEVYEVVKVAKGDTLWDIADRYNEQFGVSLVKMLDQIYEFNKLSSSTIHPGQLLDIPIVNR